MRTMSAFYDVDVSADVIVSEMFDMLEACNDVGDGAVTSEEGLHTQAEI